MKVLVKDCFRTNLVGVNIKFYRVGCCDNRASGFKCSNNASLWNWDSLLFHGLMNRSSICVIHLIKLINKTNTLVSKNKGPSFQSPFLGNGRPLNICSQSNSRCTLGETRNKVSSTFQTNLFYILMLKNIVLIITYDGYLASGVDGSWCKFLNVPD